MSDRIAATEADYEHCRQAVDCPLQLAVFDASAGAFDAAGLDDNARKDVERFSALFIRPLWHAGVATILIDHVVKAKDHRGRYSIGSERKMGGVDVHLGFEVVEQISRGQDGLARYRHSQGQVRASASAVRRRAWPPVGSRHTRDHLDIPGCRVGTGRGVPADDLDGTRLRVPPGTNRGEEHDAGRKRRRREVPQAFAARNGATHRGHFTTAPDRAGTPPGADPPTTPTAPDPLQGGARARR